MAQPIKISPPTAEETEKSLNRDFYVNPVDPRSSSVDPGTTPDQAPFMASAPIEPSRVTGKFDEGTSQDYDSGGMLNPMNVPGVGDFVRGANDLILALPDMAINAVAEGLEAAGIVEPNTVDRRYLARLFNSSDFESQKVIIPYLLHYGTGAFAGQSESEGALSAIARGTGQATIASLPIVGMELKAAQMSGTAPAALSADASLGTRIADTLVAPFRSSPGTATAIETTLGGASGAGAVAEQEIFGTNTGIGALVPLAPAGLIYGGSKVAKGPLGQGFSWIKNKVTGIKDDVDIAKGGDPAAGAKGEAATAELSADLKAAASTPEAQSNIARASEIEATLGGYADEPIALSPAETTMDMPLLVTQTKIEGGGTADFTRANNARKNNVLTAAQRFIDGELTGSPVDDAPLFIVDEATGAYTKTIGALDDEAQTIANQWDMVTNAETGVYPALGSRAEVGASIRDTIVKAQTAAKASADEVAKKLGVNKDDPLAGRDATAEAQNAVRSALTSGAGDEAISYKGLPGLVKEFIEFKFKDGQISFQDWKRFRDQVSQGIGKAISQGASQDLRSLAILGENLDKMGVAFGKTNKNFEDFRAYYEANVILPFEKSGVVRVTSKGSGGSKEAPSYWLSDEQVASSFLEDTNMARQYVSLFADDPAQMRNIKSVVLDKLRAVADPNRKGVFNPDAVNTYLNKNREVLTELGLFDDLTNTTTMLDDMVARQAELVARRRVVDGNMLNKMIARSLNSDSPNKLFDEAINNPAKMRELKAATTKGNDDISAEDAGHAFRAAVTERMLAKAPDVMSDPAKFKEWMVKNEEVLNAAFDKSHIDNMYLIADATERILATGIRGGQGVTDSDIISKFTGMLGTTPAGISNRFIAVQEGRLGSKAMVGYIVSRAIRQQSSARSEALFRESMFDPKIAKLLASEGGDDVAEFGASEPAKRAMNAYLFNLGISYGDGVTGEGDKRTYEFTPNITTQPVTETPPPVQPEPEPVRPFQYAPTPKIQPAPAPTQTSQVGIETLFPNDPTSIAIAKRRGAGQGAMRTV